MINSKRSTVYLRLLGLALCFYFVLIIVIYGCACRNSIGIKDTFQGAQHCPLLNFIGPQRAGKEKILCCPFLLISSVKCQPDRADTLFCNNTALAAGIYSAVSPIIVF